MKVKITVTAEDIKKGLKENTARCAVARAARRVFKGRKVYVLQYVLEVCRSWKYKTFYLPRKTTAFIRKFDRGLKVKPFSFYARKI